MFSFQLAKIRPQSNSSPTRILPLHWDEKKETRIEQGGTRLLYLWEGLK